MTPERWQQITQIFQAARVHDQTTRAAYLDQACRNDPSLRAEVEQLLAGEVAAGAFFDAPLSAGPAAVPWRAGTQVGIYRIEGRVGAGGMGEVYRARDTRLGRDVAIKVLPPEMVADPERRTRLEREARLLAALNHPHIAAIYGLEEHDGLLALVLEFVDGPTLADRLTRGPIPPREAVGIAREIADAIETAHDKGIIHRDLKPANVKLAPAAGVKVLDFGLAKAAAGASDVDASQLPTVTAAGTRAGQVMGTAAYMSPEQARGLAVDQRTDVWAFGCVLYEMLAGRGAFEGQTVSDTLVAVLEREPDWAALPATTSPRLRWLLRRCLEKDAKRRWRDIGDAALELQEGFNPDLDAASTSASASISGRTRERIAWFVAAAALLALIVASALRSNQVRPPGGAESPTLLSSISLPDGLRLMDQPARRFALSPDGVRLAIVASQDNGPQMLWVRPLSSPVVQPVPGTEGASSPFWSPDSRFIAFVAQGRLKRVDLVRGVTNTICEPAVALAGAWNSDDVILFTPRGLSALYRVSAAGGTASPATTLDEASGDTQHEYPTFLPDGRHFLYLALGSQAGGAADPRAVYIGSLDPREPPKPLMQGGSNIRYAQGHVLFLRQGTLVTQVFDPARFELQGEPVPLVERTAIVSGTVTGAAGAFSVSDTGLLVYQTGFGIARSSLAWFNRAGEKIETLGDEADYGDLAVSPDGTRVAVGVLDLDLGTHDLWIYSVARGLRERFTTDPSDEFGPTWSPDSTHIAFSARRNSSVDLYKKAISGTESEQKLLGGGVGKFLESWSHDGHYLLYVAGGAAIFTSDLWALPLGGDHKPFPVVQTPAQENQGQFSPDGRWIAYASAESGQFEVYVAPFQHAGERKRVSVAGGFYPRWGKNGREILYLTPDDTLTTAAVSIGTSNVEVGTVRPLFKIRPHPAPRLDAYPYDLSRDGTRILINALVAESAPTPMTLVANWTASLSKK